jgi:hypothetical protein
MAEDEAKEGQGQQGAGEPRPKPSGEEIRLAEKAAGVWRPSVGMKPPADPFVNLQPAASGPVEGAAPAGDGPGAGVGDVGSSSGGDSGATGDGGSQSDSS